MTKIKTYILTGFLGAGKTTVLNYLLNQVENQKNLIVENEFGKVNIDSGLIDKKYDAIYELTNGCICCTYDEGFFDLLGDIVLNKKDAENLFIETTGVADISPIISLFNRQDVKPKFDLINTICVCDAEVVEDFLSEIPEVENQIVQSDIILVNKSTLVHPSYLVQLKQTLQTCNPFAKIIETSNGHVDLKSVQEKLEKIVPSPIRNNTGKSHKITSIFYETDAFLDLDKLRFVLSTTMLLYYKQIIRIKGYFIGSDNQTYLLQTAGKSLSIVPVHDKVISKTQLVFLVKDVKDQTIERIIKQIVITNKKQKYESSVHF